MSCGRLTTVVVMLACLSASGYSNIASDLPFGLALNPSSCTAVNMGGAAAGVLDANNILLANPANLGGITKTAFSSFFSVDILRISQDSRHSDHIAVAPHHISFAFPLGVGGVIALSLAKETDATVKFQTDSSRLPDSDFFGKLAYHKAGGITSWRAGWGHSIGKWAYVGVAYERLYLEVNSTRIVDLTDYVANSTRDSTRVHFSGHGFHLGVMVPIAKATIGLTGRYVLKDDLSYFRGQYRLGESTPFVGTESNAGSTLRIPPHAVLGVSYRFSPQWLAASDLRMVRWKDYSAHGILPDVNIDYAMTFGAGVRFIPAPRLLAPKYWETIHYRLGFNVAQLPRDGTNQFAFSLGCGFPVRGGGLLDLVASGGRRTDDAYPDYSENFVQIGIGINGGRKWSRGIPRTY